LLKNKQFIKQPRSHKPMTINSRTKGHSYERKIVNELRTVLKKTDIWTSRNMSLRMDSLGVDIVGDVPWHVQCKAVESHQPVHNMIRDAEETLSDKPLIVFHKRKRTPKCKGGEVVSMSKELFYEMVRELEARRSPNQNEMIETMSQSEPDELRASSASRKIKK
jgi:hypothetical protein